MAFATKTAFPPRPRRRTRRATRARRDFGVFFGKHGRTRDVRTSTRSTRASSSRSRASRTPPRRFPRPREGRREAHLRLGRFREERIRRNPLSVTRRVVVVRDKRVLAGCVRRRAPSRERRRAPPRPPARAPARAAPRPASPEPPRRRRRRSRRARPRPQRWPAPRGGTVPPRTRRRPRRTPGRRPPFSDSAPVGLRARAARLRRRLRKWTPRGARRTRTRTRPRGTPPSPASPRLASRRAPPPRARPDHARAKGTTLEPLADEARFPSHDAFGGICGIRFLRRLRRSSSVCLRRVFLRRERYRRLERTTPPRGAATGPPNRRRVGERADARASPARDAR